MLPSDETLLRMSNLLTADLVRIARNAVGNHRYRSERAAIRPYREALKAREWPDEDIRQFIANCRGMAELELLSESD